MRTPEQDRIWIDGRLPRKQWISVPEICSAFCLSPHTVIAYIDTGRVTNVRNKGVRQKRYFEVWRDDVIELWLSMRFTG